VQKTCLRAPFLNAKAVMDLVERKSFKRKKSSSEILKGLPQKKDIVLEVFNLYLYFTHGKVILKTICAHSGSIHSSYLYNFKEI
jgi:hypothetical protein